ncbi:hypothetical protein B0T16DRAFT_9378 [Cercophora newfieldiana]|uniref:Uncharacterized protein n=1 Tax=Cercophora newfieldiana TaxID=92897 RepID=A0AA39YNY1_9PEZI|nr:hypothetical protein B0T16DRAFT_9378 [Cercophora newfieldiana]
MLQTAVAKRSRRPSGSDADRGTKRVRLTESMSRSLVANQIFKPTEDPKTATPGGSPAKGAEPTGSTAHDDELFSPQDDGTPSLTSMCSSTPKVSKDREITVTTASSTEMLNLDRQLAAPAGTTPAVGCETLKPGAGTTIGELAVRHEGLDETLAVLDKLATLLKHPALDFGEVRCVDALNLDLAHLRARRDLYDEKVRAQEQKHQELQQLAKRAKYQCDVKKKACDEGQAALDEKWQVIRRSDDRYAVDVAMELLPGLKQNLHGLMSQAKEAEQECNDALERVKAAEKIRDNLHQEALANKAAVEKAEKEMALVERKDVVSLALGALMKWDMR